MKKEEPLKSSKGHDPGSLDEHYQQADKPKADSPATSGIENRDEDAADPENVGQDESSEGPNLPH